MLRRLFAVVLMGATVVCLGCDPDEPAGGPGADSPNDNDTDPENEEATFTASLGDDAIDLAAGSEVEVDLNIERGEDFDEKVTVEINAPDNITVTPAEVEFASAEESRTITVAAAAGATVGREVAIEITFKPETGREIVKQLTVMVVEPEPEEEGQEDEDVDQVEIDGQE